MVCSPLFIATFQPLLIPDKLLPSYEISIVQLFCQCMNLIFIYLQHLFNSFYPNLQPLFHPVFSDLDINVVDLSGCLASRQIKCINSNDIFLIYVLATYPYATPVTLTLYCSHSSWWLLSMMLLTASHFHISLKD